MPELDAPAPEHDAGPAAPASEDAPRSGKPKKKHKSPGGQLLELLVIVGVALGLALAIQAVLVKPYRIPSGSMLPTLEVGQRVLVNRIGSHFGDPSIGDIVVFHPPAPANGDANGRGPSGQCGTDYPEGQPCPKEFPGKSDVNFVKRVVAGPGDRIAIVDGHVILNGKRQKESFIRPCQANTDCDFPKPITVPAGHWFMMGDNRGESDDSRYWGPVPKKWIIGGVFATYWPPRRINIF